MKINFSNPTFSGVEIIGSIKNDKKNKDYLPEWQAQILKAEVRKSNLDAQGIDTFIVESSVKDHLGANTGSCTTYLLTGDAAKVVNNYENIKKELYKMFSPVYSVSDLFCAKFNKQIDDITAQQNKVAEFIAVNKLPL